MSWKKRFDKQRPLAQYKKKETHNSFLFESNKIIVIPTYVFFCKMVICILNIDNFSFLSKDALIVFDFLVQ